jgi:trehalose-phosphatase
MLALRQGLSLSDLFRSLRGAERRALLLDYDGTLAPFRIDPARAEPYPGIREALAAILAAGHTRLVIVTGRAIRDLMPLLRLDPLPEVWGSHGWEPATPEETAPATQADLIARAAMSEAAALAPELEARHARIELKPSGLAVHWRGLAGEDAEAIRCWLESQWTALDLGRGLNWCDFDGGVELRLPGRDKGHVVDRLLGEMGAGTVAAYLGDDLTDEDAFRAIRGRGTSILVREEFRPTAADFLLRPPEEVLDFLARWNEAAAGGGPQDAAGP